MRILIITITPNSAVDRLALQVQKYNEHLFIDVLPFHPKRFSQDDLNIFEEKAKEADLIDFQYFKNALVLLEKFPWLRDKPKILTHHNPYDLHQSDWKQFNAVIVKNKTQMKELKGSLLIPHSVDLNFFKFNQDYDVEKKIVGMVAFRIEGKKGIRETAQVCKELGYKFLLVGRVSRPEYMKEIMKVNPDTDFRENQTDEEVRDAYKEMSILVCNSVDDFESGPLPVLEAMATGIPVLTREVGLVPDIYNERNLVVRNGKQEDVGDLKWELKTLMKSKERRLDLREAGWQTVKNMSAEKSARQYTWIYNKVMFNEPLVSVIIPTYNRKEQVVEILNSLSNQNYENIEAIICDDNSDDGTEQAVKQMREQVQFPIKFLNTEKNGYNLAEARNMGVVEAEGDVLIFCDSRLKPHLDAVYQFMKYVIKDKEKVWYYGDKGSGRRGFVENWSAIRKYQLVAGGMFNERITEWGGTTQELSLRFGKQGFKFRYLPFARAKEILSSKSKKTKKDSVQRMKLLLWKLYGN